MKVVLDYDAATGQIKSKDGMLVGNWIGLQYEEFIEQEPSKDSGINGDQLIKIMKMSAYISSPDKASKI